MTRIWFFWTLGVVLFVVALFTEGNDQLFFLILGCTSILRSEINAIGYEITKEVKIGKAKDDEAVH